MSVHVGCSQCGPELYREFEFVGLICEAVGDESRHLETGCCLVVVRLKGREQLVLIEVVLEDVRFVEGKHGE